MSQIQNLSFVILILVASCCSSALYPIFSFTSRHLSEFWMIEPEIAFADLTDDINLAEDYLKYCVKYALECCADDLEFFENSPHGEKGLRDRLRNVLENPFKVSSSLFQVLLFCIIGENTLAAS